MKTLTSFSDVSVCPRLIGKWFFASCIASLLFLIALQPASAQKKQRRIFARTARPEKGIANPQKMDAAKLPVVKSSEPNKIETNDNSNAIALVNAPETDYLSGEASVTVNPKQPTIVRLGLAQNAVSIVEFPASDGIYYIHEGNPNLVAVFQSPTKETDHFITLNPSQTFIPSSDSKKSPSVTVTLQMRSGLVLILEVVPVADIKHNAHRCVVSYNREDVISARRAAGLAFDLGDETKTVEEPQKTKAASTLVSEPVAPPAEKPIKTDVPSAARVTYFDIIGGGLTRKPDERRQNNLVTADKISKMVNKKLAETIKNSNRSFAAWSPSSYGLRIATSSVAEIDDLQRLVVVAVRNESTANLRLVAGFPELQIQTTDEKGNVLQVERLDKSYVETTSLGGLVTPGGTIYYAIVYNAPVTSASQRLRVLVSQTEAADAPATAALSGFNKDKN